MLVTDSDSGSPPRRRRRRGQGSAVELPRGAGCPGPSAFRVPLMTRKFKAENAKNNSMGGFKQSYKKKIDPSSAFHAARAVQGHCTPVYTGLQFPLEGREVAMPVGKVSTDLDRPSLVRPGGLG
jgi:hypothetical protein